MWGRSIRFTVVCVSVVVLCYPLAETQVKKVLQQQFVLLTEGFSFLLLLHVLTKLCLDAAELKVTQRSTCSLFGLLHVTC